MKDDNNQKDDNFLLYIPRKKHESWEVKNGRVFLMFYHNKTVEKFMRWLVKKPNISDVELDEMGSQVWLLIDDNANVYEIGKKLEDIFGEKINPVYDRLVMYLRYLNRKGWISFRVEENKKAN